MFHAPSAWAGVMLLGEDTQKEALLTFLLPGEHRINSNLYIREKKKEDMKELLLSQKQLKSF